MSEKKEKGDSEREGGEREKERKREHLGEQQSRGRVESRENVASTSVILTALQARAKLATWNEKRQVVGADKVLKNRQQHQINQSTRQQTLKREIKYLCHVDYCRIQRGFTVVIVGVFAHITSQLCDLDFIRQLALETRVEDFALSRLCGELMRPGNKTV